jgi:uncharacterized membrane protein YgdD (TMEM256/DUF423 family)
MNSKTSILTGIVVALLTVIIGAFGAHGLSDVLESNARTETFELAVRYQFYHAFALVFAGLIARSDSHVRSLRMAPLFFLAGIIFFSGSLYILSLTNTSWLGAVTPFGGLFFIAGWAVLLFGARQVLK